MSYSRHSSLDAGAAGITTGSSTTPHNTSDSGPRSEETDDAMNLVYKAIAENPGFIKHLADVLRPKPEGLRGPSGPAGSAGVAGVVQPGHWRADEVRFFFPDLHHSYGTTDIVTIGKDSFYRNASVFLDRLDDIVKLRGGEVVRSNIPTCLRGAALQWYTTEVSDKEKAFLRSLSTTSNPQNPIHRWKVAIPHMWDPPASVAVQNFMSTRYTLAMAMEGVSMIQYFSTKIRLAKEAGFTNVYQQLLAVWNGLDVEIREHILEPDDDTSIEEFRKSLEERERLWKEKLLKNGFGQPSLGRHPCHMSASGYDHAIRSDEHPWAPPVQNLGGPHYQAYNRG